MANEIQLSKKPIIVWWKDRKLLTGIIFVLLSLILGTYGKVLFIFKFYEPVQVITGLSIYAFSWVLLFVGAFLVGWETIKLIQQRIHYHVKNTAKKTYHYTKGIPRRSFDYTRGLHRKGIDRLKKLGKNPNEPGIRIMK
ncbi:MAG TPA: hypothetical protein VI564_03520 [Candidatus Nanoarchaeia archaeon]|nr:hypothetical protein [Candidatus Nanoarchaeia archaeon]